MLERIRDEQTVVRLLPKVKEAAITAAADEDQSLSNFIETTLMDRLKKSGHLKMIRTRWQQLILVCAFLPLALQPSKADETIEDIAKSEPIIEILKGHTIPGVKNAYDVILDRRITEAEIVGFAYRILMASPRAERTFIAYSLRGMELDNGAWATSHFNPDLRVDIMELFTGNNPPDEDLRIADPFAAWVEYKKQKENGQ